MQEFAVHYEDATANWRSITASNHLAAAKDFALQSPRSGDCSIVVKTRNKSPEERWVYDRVGATYIRRAEIVSAAGHKAGNTAAGAGPSNSYSELRVMRLPLRRSALFLAVFLELFFLLQCLAIAAVLFLLGLSQVGGSLSFAQWLINEDGPIFSFSYFMGALVACVVFFPLLFLFSALSVFLVNCALKLTGGLPIWVRR
jgi:hypothetical protein